MPPFPATGPPARGRDVAHPGPADDRPTRQRLLDAAEVLLAERGPAAMSVRDVLTAAGAANASAVGYYFGSKEKLVDAVERRAVQQVDAERVPALEALGERPSAADLVRTWLTPVVRLRGTPRGALTARVYTRIFEEPRERWEANGAADVFAVQERFVHACAHLLPHADHRERAWRWQTVTALMHWYVIGYLDVFAEPSPEQVERDLDRLVAQGVAVLLAPGPMSGPL